MINMPPTRWNRHELGLIAKQKCIALPLNQTGKFYNSCTEPCDMLSGPCACGAFHGIDEWPDNIIAEALTEKAKKDPEDIIEDGFGSAISAVCPSCGKKTMQVVRPGKFQCSECG